MQIHSNYCIYNQKYWAVEETHTVSNNVFNMQINSNICKFIQIIAYIPVIRNIEWWKKHTQYQTKLVFKHANFKWWNISREEHPATRNSSNIPVDRQLPYGDRVAKGWSRPVASLKTARGHRPRARGHIINTPKSCYQISIPAHNS